MRVLHATRVMRGRRLTWLALALAGCGGPEPTRAVQSSIVFGDPSPSPGPDDAVLLLRATTPDGGHGCSATLIAPNLVVTARHCVADLAPGLFDCSREGELISNPTGGGQLGIDLPAESLEFHTGEEPDPAVLARGAQVISSLSPSICSDDIAFVVLDRALELPRKPIRLGTPTRPGEIVTLIGYGISEKPSTDWRENPRHRMGDLRIREVGPDSIEDGVFAVPPRQIELQGPSACFGDSGGPALSETSDAVVGVYSLANNNDCTAPDVLHHFTHVSPYGTLARRAYAAAGAEPYVEPDPVVEPDAGSAADAGCAGDDCVPAPAAEEDTGCTLGRAPRTGSLGWTLALCGWLSAVRRADRRLRARRAARS